MSGINLDDDVDSQRKQASEAPPYEWESELEEYDEPDCYPCEKDYQMVDELVSDESEEEEELELKQRESIAKIPEEDEKEEVPPEEAEKAGEEGQKEGEEKEKEEGEEKEKDAEKKEGEEEDDEVFVAEHEEGEEEKDKVPKKKRYKTVRVRKLIERGPKIHYEPDLERVNAMSSDVDFFTERPFEMLYSFGYDCQRMANLHLLDDHTLVFMSGFVLTFFDLHTGNKTYHRCIGGSCFGALCIHPSRKLFAAAEKGDAPIVGIWSWPKLQLFRKLCGGAEAVYASVNFSPDGKLLASQGAEPDYLITVWNWLAEMPVLRVKSHAQDVYRVTFSNELAGNLTTSGLCHIKFWKMASTFTGLKLKGDIGRFGKTELSDIEAYAELADGKVVSGSEWGNLLVWENGLIVAEICADDDQPCHKGIVRQVFMHDGDFMTTGQDGYVRVWNHDAIDTSEVSTTEHSNKVPLKTMAEVCIDESADIWYLINEFPDATGNLSGMWFAQDGKGVVWSVDLSFLHTAKDPQKVLTGHGGAIVACQLSESVPFMATLCRSGEVRVNCYTTKTLMASRSFSCAGSCLLWPSQAYDNKCITLVVGFEDGSLRILSLSRRADDEKDLPMTILLESVCKPHSRTITSIAMDYSGDIMATGSLDGTIFFFDARNQFAPMVFTGSMDYKPVLIVRFARQSADAESEAKKVVAAIEGGMMIEVTVPKLNEIDNQVSYFDENIKITRRYEFMSVKSQILHDEQIEREREEAEQRQRETDAINRKLIEDGDETQEEQNFRLLLEADEIEIETKKLMEERKKWKPYIPPEPSPILFMMQSPFRMTDWILSMGKYDAGFLYVVQLKTETELKEGGNKIREPITSVAIQDYDDMGVSTMCMSADGSRIYMGFEDGRIRCQHLYSPFEIDSLGPFWAEGIHDCIRGNISALVMAPRSPLLFSTGHDGNSFMFSLRGAVLPDAEQPDLSDFPDSVQRVDIRDSVDFGTPTLEIFKNQEKELALLAEAKKNKATKREKIQLLRVMFNDLVKRNKELPENERLTPIEFSITSDNVARKKNDFEMAKNLLEKTMAWECAKCSIALNKMKSYYRDVSHCDMFVLKAFQSDLVLSSFRISKFPPFFEDAKKRSIYDATPPSEGNETSDGDNSSESDFDAGLPPKPKYKRDMDKFVYQGRVRRWRKKQKRANRRTQWHEFYKTEPTEKDLRAEELQIAYAAENMGDMKLKTSHNYKVPEDKRPTANRVRKSLIRLEESMFEMQDKFNKEMKLLRQYKIIHLENIRKSEKKLLEAHNDIPIPERVDKPFIPEMGPDEDPDAIIKYTKDDVQKFKESFNKTKKSESTTQQKKTEAKPMKRQMVKRKSTFHQDRLAKETKEIDRDLGAYVEKEFAVPTKLEEEINNTKYLKASFNQKYYNSLILKEMANFDTKLKLLRHKKVYLDYILKMADARMTLLTQEFLLVSKSEAMTKQSNAVIARTAKERKDCLAELKVYNKKLEAVKKVMDGFAKQRLALQGEVVAIAKEKAPIYEKYLIRVFRKKFAKPKEKRADSDGSDSESDDSSSESDMDMSESDEDDDGLDVDLPPTDLSTEVYEAVIAVRERRREIDHEEEDTLAGHDEIMAAINALKTRQTAAEKENDVAYKKVEAIMLEQSHQQNDIDFAVSVKQHQIHHMDVNLCQAILTNRSNIQRLQNRIPELEKEKKLERTRVFDNKKEYARLQHSKQRFLNRIEEKNVECDKEMTKKFGVVADVEFLENFTVDPEIQDLQRKLQDEKDRGFQMEADMQEKIASMQLVATDAVRMHSSRLFAKAHMLADLSEMQHSMETYLKAFPSGLEDTAYTKEIKELKQMVVAQWRAIHYLNLEIHKLSVKPNPPLPPIRP